ncbi:hypothetical protein E8E12_009752 [Didymella heteroderae]|uniref:Heterokaryon incompatibility domain-containing protein n=1 Tax=Didymella heteroderae TaxID=1769908 RepID=A0A9P4WWN9_9PLEO|nr:hypothetical protein E8E12_009752 [Didymella heteroderae]
MAAFEKAIPSERLSTVFTDAIDVTRRAGIHYLWIDSLCILQDSKDDWAHESALMGDVYKYGHLNIAATADAEGGDGLFADRHRCVSRPGHVTTNWTHISNAQYIWTSSEQAWTPPSATENGIQSRGWILQESYLSPRTIHFSDWQLQWECRHGFTAEAWPFRFPDMVVGPYLPQAVESVKMQLGSDLAALDIHFKWASLVRRYMGCQLTRETDRLIAFSAIAREFATVMNDTYVAGLWKNEIVSQLDWSVHERHRKFTHPTGYIAPSWSWASVGAKIQFPARHMTSIPNEMLPLVQVVEAFVDPEFDEFGALRGGRLLVRGLLGKAVTAVIAKPPESMDHTEDAWVGLRESKSGLLPPEVISEGIESFTTKFSSKVHFDTLELSRIDHRTLLLPTLSIKSYGDARIVGVMLQEVEGQSSMYERVGRFELGISLHDNRDLDMDYDMDDLDEDDSFDGWELHPDHPNYDTRKYWMWDLLWRTFAGDSQSLFYYDAETDEYRLRSLGDVRAMYII